jgi:hypothetical protein
MKRDTQRGSDMYCENKADAAVFNYETAHTLMNNINTNTDFTAGGVAVVKAVKNNRFVVVIVDTNRDDIKYVKFEAIAD